MASYKEKMMSKNIYYALKIGSNRGVIYESYEVYRLQLEYCEKNGYQFDNKVFSSYNSAESWCSKIDNRIKILKRPISNPVSSSSSQVASPKSNTSYRSNRFSSIKSQVTSPKSNLSYRTNRFRSNKPYVKRMDKPSTQHGRDFVMFLKKRTTNPQYSRRTNEKYYAISFGSQHGVFDSTNYREILQSCEYSRYKDCFSREYAETWIAKDRAKYMDEAKKLILDDEGFIKEEFPKIKDYSSEDEWLDKMASYCYEKNIPFIEKTVHKLKVELPKIHQPLILDENLEKPIDGETRTIRYLIKNKETGAYVAIVGRIRATEFMSNSDYSSQSYPTYAEAESVYLKSC